MDLQVRCPWVAQNDANSDSHLPFLCGAAAAQMILYGRDDARFEAAGGTTRLAVPPAARRRDQLEIWQAIVAESRACRLPRGARYDGDPEQEQVREDTGTGWATFPKALEKALDHGVPLATGALAGVPATARAVGRERSIEEAIVASLERGVAAALLLDGVHWVVVYRYRETDDGDVAIYYRDGLLPKVESNAPVSISAFESELMARPAGVFAGKYVAVTASSSVPVVARRPHALRPRRVRRARAMAAAPLERVSFPDSLARELPERLAHRAEWTTAYDGAQPEAVLPARLQGRRGPGFYVADFGAPRAAAKTVRAGRAIVHGGSLQPVLVAGIDDVGQELPALLGREQARRVLDDLLVRRHAESRDRGDDGGAPVLDPDTARLGDELTWTMCDQSTSPFLPFYVVQGRDARTGAARTLHLRADGRWLGELTARLAGI